MSRLRSFASRSLLVIAIAMTTLGSRPVPSSHEQVLYSFQNTAQDGNTPFAGLIFDTAGNLYGTTAFGGNGGCPSAEFPGCGTVFELSPESGGGWTETVLYNFQQDGSDGIYPYADVILDASGNLYGTTEGGGSGGECSSNGFPGCGTVFELSPQSGGRWTESVLHSFQNNLQDGIIPFAGLILDASGNLYGTTGFGGTTSHGTVFELLPQSGGGWAEAVLHSFNGTDGNDPGGSLILDAVGNLYGTAQSGGSSGCTINAVGCGTVFELSPNSGGHWTEKVLHTFQNNGRDGNNPIGGLIFDAAGNLYGATGAGGSAGAGTVFQLKQQSGGGWAEQVLYTFSGTGKDGSAPTAGLVLDKGGNLIGTALGGRGQIGGGVVFEVRRIKGGAYAERLLYDFMGRAGDGIDPEGGVILDTAGNLYGTTAFGGSSICGAQTCRTVFELTP